MQTLPILLTTHNHTHTHAHTFTYTHSCKYLNPTNNFIYIIILPINISLSSAAFHFTIIVRNAQCFHVIYSISSSSIEYTMCFFLTLLNTFYNSLLPQYIRLDFLPHKQWLLNLLPYITLYHKQNFPREEISVSFRVFLGLYWEF